MRHYGLRIAIRLRLNMGKRANHSPLCPFVFRRPQDGPGRTSSRPSPPTSAAASSTPSSAWRPQSRAPVIRHTARAVPSASALSSGDRDHLMTSLMHDVRARSAAGPHASHLATWTRYHRRWFGDASTPWPLTPLGIYAVAAQFKELGYRTFPGYASSAKDEHLSLGHPWSANLALAVRHASASTQRGIGAPHQCSELRLPDAISVMPAVASLSAGGPGNCCDMFVLAYFHVVRGIEIVSALARHLHIDSDALTETWDLPVSKTDVLAVGCSRTWGCTCGSSIQHCPYHAAVSHHAWLINSFGDAHGALPADLPLFPTTRGDPVTADQLSATVEALASRLDLPLHDDLGRASYTKQVFRVSGSRMLARCGVPLSSIKLMARWSSSVIDRYIGEAPLEGITACVAGQPTGTHFADPRFVPVALDDSLSNRVFELETHLQLVSSAVDPGYVVNCRTGVAHSRGQCGRSFAQDMWRTPCGWRFGLYAHKWVSSIERLEPDLLCSSCLPLARQAAFVATRNNLA